MVIKADSSHFVFIATVRTVEGKKRGELGVTTGTHRGGHSQFLHQAMGLRCGQFLSYFCKFCIHLLFEFQLQAGFVHIPFCSCVRFA